jgi:putative Mn2+ efflux pump MntP
VDQCFVRSPFIGFAPWIIYWVVADGPSTWMFGALCAVISALILGVSAGWGGPRLLEMVTIVFFITVTVVGLVVGARDRDWMDTYATTVSAGVLAVVVVGALGMTQIYPAKARENARPV